MDQMLEGLPGLLQASIRAGWAQGWSRILISTSSLHTQAQNPLYRIHKAGTLPTAQYPPLYTHILDET